MFQVKQVYVAPGNVGISQVDKVKCVPLDIKDHKVFINRHITVYCNLNNSTVLPAQNKSGAMGCLPVELSEEIVI